MSDDRNLPASEQELKERILSSMAGSFKGEETSRWIAAIKEDAMDEAEEAVATGSTENKLSNTMSSLIDALFDHFKRYSFEFNRIQENKELEVFCERPTSMRTTAEYMDMGKTIKFCLGHLGSKSFALIIQGEENSIRAFLTPIEYLMGFKPNQSDFPTFMHMKRGANATATDFIWTIDGKPLAMTSIPALSRRLFTQLIKVQRGEANYDEKFLFDPHEPEAPQASSVDRTFEKDDAAIFVSEKPKRGYDSAMGLKSYAVASTSPGVASAPIYQAPVATAAPVPPIQPRDFPVAMQMPSVSKESPKESPKEISPPEQVVEPTQLQMPITAPAPAPVLVSAPAPVPAPAPAPLPVHNPVQIPVQVHAPLKSPFELPVPEAPSQASAAAPAQSQSHFFHAAEPDKSDRNIGRDIEKEAAEANRKVAHAIKNLFDTVDGSISGLTQMGVEAMHNDDIAAVGEIMKHTKGLKALRDSMVQLSKDWQKNL